MIYLRVQMQQNIRQVSGTEPDSQNGLKFSVENSENCGNSANLPQVQPRNSQNEAEKIFQNQIKLSEIVSLYALRPDFLPESDISELMRAKLRVWIMESCHVRSLSRQTSSLACYLLDLYLALGNACTPARFHQLGICCLKVANKIEDNRQIAIDPSVFPHQVLAEIEEQLLFGLDFNLSPTTPVEIAKNMLRHWKSFLQSELKDPSPMTNCGMSKKLLTLYPVTSNLLFELLDFVLLVPQIYKFDLRSLVVGCLYLLACIVLESVQKPLNCQKIKKFFSSKFDLFAMFNNFLAENVTASESLNKDSVSQLVCLFVYPLYNCLISNKNLDSFKTLKIADLNDQILKAQFETKYSDYEYMIESKYELYKRFLRKSDHKRRRSSDVSTKENTPM